jgi:hypothetical protein
VEAHQSWTGPCECVKPLLYRISLDKEEIKFCTAASDKVGQASQRSAARRTIASVGRSQRSGAAAQLRSGLRSRQRAARAMTPAPRAPADRSAQGPQGQGEAGVPLLQEVAVEKDDRGRRRAADPEALRQCRLRRRAFLILYQRGNTSSRSWRKEGFFWAAGGGWWCRRVCVKWLTTCRSRDAGRGRQPLAGAAGQSDIRGEGRGVSD